MSCEDCISRRKFLESGVQAASVLAIASPLGVLLSSCGQNPLAVVTGPTSSIQADATNGATFSFSSYPALQNTGGSLHISIITNAGVSRDVFVTRVSTTVVDTVSAICTHLQCELSPYNSSAQQYFCNCHGSVFSVAGAVVTGPATTPLTSYVSALTPSAVQVTIA